MRRVARVVVPIVVVAGCDVVDPEPSTVRAPTIGAPSFQVSSTGVTIVDLGHSGNGHSAPVDINDVGQIVVSSHNAFSEPRSFIWTNGERTDLPPDFGASAIGDAGQVVGSCKSPDAQVACVWDNGVMTLLGTVGTGDRSTATAINRSGQIVGYGNIAPTSLDRRGFLWENEVLTDLGATEAWAINDARQVLMLGPSPSGAWYHAWLWAGGVKTDLGSLGGPASVGNAINGSGQVVGWSHTGGPPANDWGQAFIWQNGVMTDIGSAAGAFTSQAIAINDAGQVVGDMASGYRGFIWQAGVLTNLGSLGGAFTSPTDINEVGEVVGGSETASGERHAFFWSNGVITDLGTLGGSESRAEAINDAGQIIGYSYSADNSSVRAVLWLAPRAANTAPTVDGGPDRDVETEQSLAVILRIDDASPNGPWAWQLAWGDGSTTTGSTTSTGEVTASHTYTTAGQYTARVTVTDAAGAAGSDELMVTVTAPPPPPVAHVLVGTGGVARCESWSRDEATAALLDAIPGTVFTAGDNVRSSGSLTDFQSCYGASWGRHKARTRPAVGHRDYLTTDATGYFSYFGAAAGDAGKGYYSYDLGEWHIVVLNSHISLSAGSAQEQWLKADLAATTKRCTLAYWDHPRFSSWVRSTVKPAWDALYAAGAEVVVNGHGWYYERFAPQTPAGAGDATRGIRQFTVGTGGQGTEGFTTAPLANSEVRFTGVYGVLKLTLEADRYSWEFVPIAGQTASESGSGSCH